ncbi:MAG: YcaO-like family protein [Desulfovibrionaceae bacterium]
MMRLTSCAKAYTSDQDKAVPPEETVARVKRVLGQQGSDILSEIRRIDSGRLGIPVFVSECGDAARRIMPTRKQMGKGASPIQAEASALMELVERYSFFTFWADETHFEPLTYSEAQARWPGKVMDVARIIQSVGETIAPKDAVRVLDTVRWRFCPALNLAEEREEYVPLDWFKKLNEFNGSSAGNTFEESIFQGACELVERHVCARIDRTEPELPTLTLEGCDDPVLARLMGCFAANGIQVVLKDFTLGMPVPTVAAVAWDPATFPGVSEIVYTAGTAASPEKAAIRALTEVAQLAGDFDSGAVYEASGLTKYTELAQIDWLRNGPCVPLSSLPTVAREDILAELRSLAAGLMERDFTLYAVSTAHPTLALCANYNFVPGFGFRERDHHASLGLFVGRILAEEADPGEAFAGFEVLDEVYPDAHFMAFFKGVLSLRLDDAAEAATQFALAEPLQPDDEKKAMAAFYTAYARTQLGAWQEAIPSLDRAIALCPEVKEYHNLRGVARFKQGDYAAAAANFNSALGIDRGSVMDLANLGVCCKHLGQTDQARDYLETALKLDPSLDFVRNHLDELEKQAT